MVAAREVDAHAPAAGELAHGALMVRGSEAQAIQDGRCARGRGPAVDGQKVLVRGGEAHAAFFAAFLAVVIMCCSFGGGNLGFGGAVLRIAVEHIVDGAAAGGVEFLQHARHGQARRHLDVAAVQVQFARQRGKQRGFAAAVRPDDTHAGAGHEGGRSAVKQQFIAAADGDLAEVDHGAMAWPTKVCMRRAFSHTGAPRSAAGGLFEGGGLL